MRPHVELIDERDYVWRPAELPHGRGTARQRNLSVDEEVGAASTSVEFTSEFTRPAGSHVADTEWYVLSGRVDVGRGAATLGPGGYLFVGSGAFCPEIAVEAGSRVLVFREGGGWGYEVASHRPTEPLGELMIRDAATMKFEPVEGEWVSPGQHRKLLRRDPTTGATTSIIWAEPGSREDRVMHHPVFEEAYTLSGRLHYNFGTFVPGTYMYRPPYIKHGPFEADHPDGCTWLIRCGGDCPVYFTADTELSVAYQPINYDLEEHPPALAGFPVRSRSIGPWDGTGR